MASRFVQNKEGVWEEGTPMDGQQVRVYNAGGGFTTYTHIDLPLEVIERHWRDEQLAMTDGMVEHLPDNPSHQKWLDYRKALREYPNHVDFPNNPRPVY